MKYIIKKPQECADEEKEQFLNLITQGGEIISKGLLDRINNCYLLGFYYNNGQVISVRALKRPKTDCTRKIFKKAGMADGARPIFSRIWVRFHRREL